MVIGTGTAILGAAAIGGLSSALSGGAKPQRSTQTTTRDVPAWLQPYMEESVQRGVDLSQTPYEAYAGERVAGLTPDELQAFELTRGLVGQQDPRFAQAQDIMGQVAQRGLGGFDQAALDPYLNPYQEQVMDISRQRQLEEFQRAQTGLSQQEAQIGAFGGSRSAIAQSELLKNYQRQQAETEAQQLYAGYGDAMSRAMAGTQMAGQAGLGMAGLAGQEQAAALQGIGALGQIGGLQRGIGQAGLDVGYQDFLTQQQHPYQQAQFAQSFINPAAGLTTGQTTTGVSTPGQPGPLQAALGSGTMMAGMMGGGFGGESVWGTAPGTPMSGGYQGPTQGSGARGFFGFEEGGEVSLASLGIDSSLYGPGKGRKLPPEYDDPMKYEENALLSRIDPSGELARSLAFDPELDVETYPGGPTRRQMMEVYQSEGLGDYELGQGYIDGGVVKGYANGGTVGLDPMQEWLQATAQFREQNPNLVDPINAGPLPQGLSTIEDMGYEPQAPSLGSPAPRGRLESLFSFSPEEKYRRAVQSAETPRPISVLGKYLTDPSRPTLGEARGQLVEEGLGALQKKPTPPLPQRRPEVKTQVESLLENLGVKPQAKSTATKATPTSEKKEGGMNIPLVNFGAAMLGSKGSFFQALGEAGKAYTTTKMTQQQAMQKAASDALKRTLDERRVAAYEKQTDVAAQNVPLRMEMQKLKIASAARKLEQDPARLKIFTELMRATPMGDPNAIMQQAIQLSGGTPTAPAGSVIKYDAQGNRI